MRLSDEVLAAARKRGSLNMVADVSWIRSAVLLRLGKLREAVEVGQYGLDLKLENSPPATAAWSAAHVIEALVALGRLAEADEVAAVVTARQPPGGWIQTALFTQARGLLQVARRRYEEGLGDLLAAAEAWRALGVASPALASWRTAAITAYAATGHADKAAALAAEQLALAREADTRLTLGIALRAGAPYADDRVATLGKAVSVLREVRADHETARALADLGAQLRRSGDRSGARWHLRRALDLAERCGAQPLCDFARRELLTAGARPRRAALTGRDALTGAEQQVAALAAEGLSNRQIAQQLFITQATV
jgi:ATP/maltotriose-dependent transcriptional regulator MalT